MVTCFSQLLATNDTKKSYLVWKNLYHRNFLIIKKKVYPLVLNLCQGSWI
jgi:hypothetical protein